MKKLIILIILCNLTLCAYSKIIYVDVNGTGSGTSWADANGVLQFAINSTLPGDQVWVKKGTYKPTELIDPCDPRTATFQMKNGVKIYGGFSGTEEIIFDINDRDFIANETILSGDLLGNDTPYLDPCDLINDPNRSDNCYHVFYHPDGLELEPNAVLDGFMIMGGNGNINSPLFSFQGGGIYNYSSSPTIQNCTFTNNSVLKIGGAICNKNFSSPVVINCNFIYNSTSLSGSGIANFLNSSPKVVNCIFLNNLADSSGGGMYNGYNSCPDIIECYFLKNSADYGGGIRNYKSMPIVRNSIFNNNSANFAGGGMCNNYYSSVSMYGCKFTGNSAHFGGGGMSNERSNPVVSNCIFNGNSTHFSGGGLRNGNSSPTLTNCIFNSNWADRDGGGMYNGYYSDATLINCTFSDNSADNGGGMYNWDSSPAISNCIIWGNIANKGNEIYNLLKNILPLISYSDIAGSGGSTSWDPNLGTDGGGNIDIEPCFVDNDNFRLLWNSPCIDAGNSDAVPVDVTTDFDGGERFVDDTLTADTGFGSHPIVDMGVYEYKVIYVRANSIDGNNTGTSWQNAFIDMNDALVSAFYGDNIWVAQGLYKPNNNYGLTNGDPNRLKHFRMKKGVAIYGGFPNNDNNANFYDRNIELNKTILSGDLLGNDIPTLNALDLYNDSNRNDNCYHVFYHPNDLKLDTTAILDGFTITSGYAVENIYSIYNGSGIYNNYCSPTIKNCTLINNSAKYGGGMFNEFRSSPTIINCSFNVNFANYGAGMLTTKSSGPKLLNCKFNYNRASYRGGGMYCHQSSPKLLYCIFVGNSAYDSGGAMCNSYFSGPIVNNCIFRQNTVTRNGGAVFHENDHTFYNNCIFTENSADYGGAMYNFSDSTKISGCTFSRNSAKFTGGAIYNYFGRPLVTNSILWANIAADFNELYTSSFNRPTISYSNIAGSGGSSKWDSYRFGLDGGGNIDVDPRFVDPDVNDFHLLPDSPCINTGDPNFIIFEYDNHYPNDLDGNPRISEGRVDMGCYEFQVPDCINTRLFMIPRALNPKARRRVCFAMMIMPSGITASDFDRSEKLTLYPAELQSRCQFAFDINRRHYKRTYVLCIFDRRQLCRLLGPGVSEIEILGWLKDDRCFTGQDAIRVINQ